MEKQNYSLPVDLKYIRVNDTFWKREMELVRTQVIPYQWEALNDNIEGAAKSYCMHNFKVAGKMLKRKISASNEYISPRYTFRGFEALPEDENKLEDKFYGFVFQDTDFSKWIEAVGYSLTQYEDEELEAMADEAIDIVCEAQLDNGYLDTYYIINGMDKSFSNLRDHHELYCLGHLIEGAVAYFQATGKRKLLDAACRFADYCADYFGEEEGKCKGYPGHEIAEMALVRLYQVTGEDKYLGLSRFFLEERGKLPYYFDSENETRASYDCSPVMKDTNPMRYAYNQAHEPVKEQKEAVGHAVRAVYLYSGMADVARLAQDEKMYDACVNLWNNIVRQKLYVTGGIGGTKIGEAFSFPYDLPNDTAYSETCAAIGLAFFARRMLQIEPKSEYADVMEQALYNTVLSGMALDGKSFFYVNPLEVNPEACKRDERKDHVKVVRQKWFGCACCPPNIARIVSSIGSYAFTENDDTLWVHLYMGGEIEKSFQGQKVRLQVKSKMPWEGNVKIEVTEAERVTGTIAVRMPDWSIASQITVKVNVDKKKEIKDGYIYLSGVWKRGDQIEINMPMEIRVLTANTRVREDIGKVAVTRGPITYCLEEKDNGKNLHLFSLKADTVMNQVQESFLEYSDEIGHPFVKLHLPGAKMTESEETDKLYQLYTPLRYENKELIFVPYYAWNNRGEGEMSVWINAYR